jgi:hypothetical protein
MTTVRAERLVGQVLGSRRVACLRRQPSEKRGGVRCVGGFDDLVVIELRFHRRPVHGGRSDAGHGATVDLG